MSTVGFPPPINPGQVGQSGSVQTQSQTGSVGGKVVNENKPPILNDSKVLHDSQPRKVLTGNHGPLKIPTSGGSARPTFASFRKSTTSTPATSQNQSVETPKTLRTSFASIKEQSPLGREGGQAMIGKNRSMSQAQVQTEVTQLKSDLENVNQTEEKSLLKSFKEFSSKISKKLDALIAEAKNLKDFAKAKLLGYDKAINEKFGEALSTKLFTFEEKKALVNFITRSSIEPIKDLDNVIQYETQTLRNALLKALPGKITDETDKENFEKLKQHGGGGYKDNVHRFDPLNFGSTSTYSDIRETTLKLCDLYKKYVDPNAFTSKSIEIKSEVNDLSSDFFKDGLNDLENDPTLTPKEKQDIRSSVDTISTEHKTAGLYILMNEKILEKYGFELVSDKSVNLKVNYKNKETYVTSYKSNEFRPKNLYTKLKNANNLQEVCNLLGLSDDSRNEILNPKSETLENAQKIKKTPQNNPKSGVKTSKTQSRKPSQDKPPVKLQTTVQAPKTQAQVLTPRQTDLRNTYCGWLYQNWNTNASGIIAALNANCPSEEQFTEFETFLKDQNNLNLNAIKTKVFELTGQQIP